jgi:hypothetical protein
VVPLAVTRPPEILRLAGFAMGGHLSEAGPGDGKHPRAGGAGMTAPPWGRVVS